MNTKELLQQAKDHMLQAAKLLAEARKSEELEKYDYDLSLMMIKLGVMADNSKCYPTSNSNLDEMIKSL